MGWERLGAELEAQLARGELAYVVVDELESGVAGLVASRWPEVDDQGRLRFDQEGDVHLAVDAEVFRALLQERVPFVGAPAGEAEEALRSRPLVVGDVFAAPRAGLPDEDVDEVTDPRQWFTGPVVDLSADAREAAKTQYYATVAGVLTPDDVDAIVDEFYGGEAAQAGA